MVFCGLEPELGAAVAAPCHRGGAGHGGVHPAATSRGTTSSRRSWRTPIARTGASTASSTTPGWHPPHRPIDDFTVDDFRAILELNVVSVFALCKAGAAPPPADARLDREHREPGGDHRASCTRPPTWPRRAPCLRSRRRWRSTRRRTCGSTRSRPGTSSRRLWQEAIDASPDPAATRQAGEDAQPFGRMGTPREVGLLCLFLATDATFTTGVDHIISGGAELGYGRKAR